MNIQNKWFYRCLEIFPGLLSWFTLIGPLILAIWYPQLVALWVIFFDLFWLFKAVEIGIRLIVGYRRLKDEDKIDYFQNIKLLEASDIASEKMSWRDIYHVVLLPSYNEGIEIIKPSLESYLAAKYPKDRIIIVLALEERAGSEINKRGEILRKEYQHHFADFLVYIHPDGIKGEIKGKSANTTWAARQLQKYLDEKKIKYDQVIVSNFDCDTRVHSQYFANLTYKYLITEKRVQKTYQPLPIFNNNIWDVPFLTRTIALSSGFWQIVESTRSYRMVNFSSQAMSMQTLVDIDFWDVSIVSEDSRQYYRAFFRYAGDHEVIPLYTPVYMDAVLAESFWGTLKAQYMQMRRWAWGIEHFPYMVVTSMDDKKIDWRRKSVEIFRIIEGHFSWATSSLFIMLSGWYPFLVNRGFSDSPLSFYLPFWAERLLQYSWLGLFISMGISLLMLPPRPPKYGRWSVFEMIFMWALVPLTASIFGSLPALEAQTRLMLGGKFRLGFWVTTKKVKK